MGSKLLDEWLFLNTAGASRSELVIRAYEKNQGIEKDYEQLFQQEQLTLYSFE